MTIQPDYCVLNFWPLIKNYIIQLYFNSSLIYV
jgi:hypothetical protein